MPAAASHLPQPRALILDLDGTLVDTVETRIRAWAQVFEEFSIAASREQLAPLIGIDGKELVRRVAGDADVPLAEDRDEEIDRRCGEIYGEMNTDPRPLPGARDLLEQLDRLGVPWAIATSSRREQVGNSVRALDLGHEPRVVDGSSVRNAKPDPELLVKAARELAIPDEGCWYVGDSVWDVMAALRAGQVPVAITAGAAVPPADLREAGAAAVFASLVELSAELASAYPSTG